jgi:hypothetical protein
VPSLRVNEGIRVGVQKPIEMIWGIFRIQCLRVVDHVVWVQAELFWLRAAFHPRPLEKGKWQSSTVPSFLEYVNRKTGKTYM